MARPSSSSSNRSRKSMRNFVGIIKDKVSLIKSTSSFHMAVIRATAHFPVDPPPISTVNDVLALGHLDSSAVVDTLHRRLRGTKNAYVALKCQLILHHILSRGSPVLKRHICSPRNNLLKLSGFSDESDADTMDLSGWVRWYAGVLEQSIISSSVLGFDFLSVLTGQNRRIVRYGEEISVRRLLSEIDSLVGLVEQISGSPESFHYQKTSLIHEVINLVGEDYRLTMREILALISEINRRIEGLTDDELDDFLIPLKKLENCREKLLVMLLNRKRNDGCWHLIEHTRKEVEEVKERRKSMRVVTFQGTGLGTIRIGGAGAHPKPRGKRWLDVAWNPLAVPTSC